MTNSRRFEVKLHPYLRAELQRKAKIRGLDLSGYIQELCWHHCPEAERALAEDFKHLPTPSPESESLAVMN